MKVAISCDRIVITEVGPEDCFDCYVGPSGISVSFGDGPDDDGGDDDCPIDPPPNDFRLNKIGPGLN